MDLPFLVPDSNGWPNDGDAYNVVSWLGQNNRDHHSNDSFLM